MWRLSAMSGSWEEGTGGPDLGIFGSWAQPVQRVAAGLFFAELALQLCVLLVDLAQLGAQVARLRVDVQSRDDAAQRGSSVAIPGLKGRQQAQACRTGLGLFPGVRGGGNQDIALLWSVPIKRSTYRIIFVFFVFFELVLKCWHTEVRPWHAPLHRQPKRQDRQDTIVSWPTSQTRWIPWPRQWVTR